MAEAMEKKYPWAESGFLHLCVWERKKITGLKLLLRNVRNAYKKCKSPIQKEFLKGLLTNISFFLYFRDHPKNGEGKKRDFESIYVQE